MNVRLATFDPVVRTYPQGDYRHSQRRIDAAFVNIISKINMNGVASFGSAALSDNDKD